MSGSISTLMAPIADILLGAPNEDLSSKDELRYGSRGSTSVDLSKGTWFDHERGAGGGVFDLIRDHTGLADQDAYRWIEEHGLEIERAKAAPRPNGKSRARPTGKIVARYEYRAEGGELLFEVVRYAEPKDFRQRRPDPDAPSGWIWSVKGVRQVPYRLPELLEQIKLGHEILIVEGEKDADACWQLGRPATCNAGGAGKWSAELNQFFRDADVCIIGDHDPQTRDPRTGELRFHANGRPILPGQDHAQDVTRHLSGVATRVRIVDLAKHWSDAPPKADISDWLALGHSREDLDALIDQATEYRHAAVTTGLGEWNAALDVVPPPPRGWLLGHSLCRRFLSSVLADGGTGKSALRILQALALATGRSLTGEHVFQRCRVLIVSLEDDADVLRRRILAARLHYDISLSELDGWLVLAAPGAKAGKLKSMNAKGQLADGQLKAHLEAAIEANAVDCVIIDPLVKTHSVEENSNSAIDGVAQLLSDLAAKYNIAVDVPHHTSKGAGDPGNAHRGRGASALIDAVRLTYTLTRMSEQEAQTFNIPEEGRRQYVRLDRAKTNLVPLSGPATWFKLVGVRLGNATETYPNGDEVQTVEIWMPPNTWADLHVGLLNGILTEIGGGMEDGTFYTVAPKASTRAAWCVICKFAPQKTEPQAREMVRTWIRNGVLIEFEYENKVTRKPATGLRVDNTKRPGTACASS